MGNGAEGKFVLNKKGVGELLKSSEMKDVIESYAAPRAVTAGIGYAYSVRVLKTRAIANIYPETDEAIQDNYENNTLLKVIGS